MTSRVLVFPALESAVLRVHKILKTYFPLCRKTFGSWSPIFMWQGAEVLVGFSR